MQCDKCHDIGYVLTSYILFGFLCFKIEKCELCLDGEKSERGTRYWMGGKEISKEEFRSGTYEKRRC